jgi:hypothetical protein
MSEKLLIAEINERKASPVRTDRSNSSGYFENKSKGNQYGETNRDDVSDVPYVSVNQPRNTALYIYPNGRVMLEGGNVIVWRM